MEYRIEHDSMGEIRVPADRLWGAQTQRTLRNFSVGDCERDRMPLDVIHALALVKAAAATANMALSGLLPEKANAIIEAAEEVAEAPAEEAPAEEAPAEEAPAEEAPAEEAPAEE